MLHAIRARAADKVERTVIVPLGGRLALDDPFLWRWRAQTAALSGGGVVWHVNAHDD